MGLWVSLQPEICAVVLDASPVNLILESAAEWNFLSLSICIKPSAWQMLSAASVLHPCALLCLRLVVKRQSFITEFRGGAAVATSVFQIEQTSKVDCEKLI